MSAFSELGLSDPLLRAIDAQGYTNPTPIQAQAIPAVLTGRDLLAAAQTGTGKTAGFTLPTLHILSDAAAPQPRGSQNQRGPRKPRRHVRALILVPTRELAAQVAESVAVYGKFLSLKSTVVFGGVNINPQISRLKAGVDILIATPGRLLDLQARGAADLSHVEILILDEADRMMDMGFIPDIRRIVKLLPKDRQNLMFSATFAPEIRELTSEILKDPLEVEIAREKPAAATVEQLVHPVQSDHKAKLLAHLIRDHKWYQVLVFTRTKHRANALARKLERDGIKSTAIHGNKSQNARTKALADFKRGRVQVLVATDIAARGLDIEQLPQVVNYELPHVAEDYVHRIGRTGRAGAAGHAISLVSADEKKLLIGIERLIRRSLPTQKIEGFDAPELNRPEPGKGGGARGNARSGGSRPNGGARPGGARTGGGNREPRRNGRHNAKSSKKQVSGGAPGNRR